jgi:hypothetical protein
MSNQNCLNLKTFKWIDNCCYIDSVIVALFITDIKFIKNTIIKKDVKPRRSNLLCVPISYNDKSIEDKSYVDFEIRKKIQNKLRLLYDYIRNKNNEKVDLTCNELRHIISLCPTEDAFYLKTMGDSADFLKYLLSLFETNVLRINKIFYGTNNIDSINPQNLKKVYDYVENESIVQNIDIDKLNLSLKKNYKISKFLNFKEDLLDDNLNDKKIKNYERTIVNRKIIDSPMIIFNFYRLFEDMDTLKETFYKTKIIPSKFLKTSGKKFNLFAIIVYENKHYSCYFLCSEKWYHYDDTSEPKIKFVGDHIDLLKYKPSPIKNGTLYFYDKI